MGLVSDPTCIWRVLGKSGYALCLVFLIWKTGLMPGFGEMLSGEDTPSCWPILCVNLLITRARKGCPQALQKENRVN